MSEWQNRFYELENRAKEDLKKGRKLTVVYKFEIKIKPEYYNEFLEIYEKIRKIMEKYGGDADILEGVEDLIYFEKELTEMKRKHKSFAEFLKEKRKKTLWKYEGEEFYERSSYYVWVPLNPFEAKEILKRIRKEILETIGKNKIEEIGNVSELEIEMECGFKGGIVTDDFENFYLFGNFSEKIEDFTNLPCYIDFAHYGKPKDACPYSSRNVCEFLEEDIKALITHKEEKLQQRNFY